MAGLQIEAGVEVKLQKQEFPFQHLSLLEAIILILISILQDSKFLLIIIIINNLLRMSSIKPIQANILQHRVTNRALQNHHPIHILQVELALGSITL